MEIAVAAGVRTLFEAVKFMGLIIPWPNEPPPPPEHATRPLRLWFVAVFVGGMARSIRYVCLTAESLEPSVVAQLVADCDDIIAAIAALPPTDQRPYMLEAGASVQEIASVAARLRAHFAAMPH